MTATQKGVLLASLLIAAVVVYIVTWAMKTAFSDNYLIEGNKKVKSKNYVEAKERYLKAVKTNKFKKGNLSSAYNNIIFCEYMLKNYDGAIAYAEKLLNIYPKDTVGYSLLGKVYFDMGNLTKAIEIWSLKNSIEEDGTTYSNIALAYAKLGNYKEANININAAQKNKFEDIKQLRKEVKKGLVEFGVKEKLTDLDKAIEEDGEISENINEVAENVEENIKSVEGDKQ